MNRTSKRGAAPAAFVCALLAACGSSGDNAPSTAATSPAAAGTTPAVQVKATTVASGLENPWSLAFLPDGRMLVTERPGRLRIVSAAGVLSPALTGVPAVFATGQGGLLDVVLSPGFATDHTIFFSFAEPVAGGMARTAVAKASLSDTALTNVQVIFRQNMAKSGGNHFGSRLVFGTDGTLFVTSSEREDRDRAQELTNHLGKVLRIRTDGSAPADNPFLGTAGAMPEIWSYGHRNLQGAALNPATGKLWTAEHGPQGGDEINAPAAGKNYGWPKVTYGVEYGSATPIGQGTTGGGTEPPLHYWVPTSIAPSGMAFYTGSKIPAWQGSVFGGALAGQALIRLSLQGDQVVSEERLLNSLGERIRDVRMGPDGNLYLLTDNASGRILRVEAQ